MQIKFGLVITALAASLLFSPLMRVRPHSNAAESVEGTVSPLAVVTAQQECVACESKCDSWVKKCTEGGLPLQMQSGRRRVRQLERCAA